MLDSCRVFVFKEIHLADQVLFQWFRIATDDEDEHIVPDVVLTADEHWALVNAD